MTSLLSIEAPFVGEQQHDEFARAMCAVGQCCWMSAVLDGPEISSALVGIRVAPAFGASSRVEIGV